MLSYDAPEGLIIVVYSLASLNYEANVMLFHLNKKDCLYSTFPNRFFLPIIGKSKLRCWYGWI